MQHDIVHKCADENVLSGATLESSASTSNAATTMRGVADFKALERQNLTEILLCEKETWMTRRLCHRMSRSAREFDSAT